MGAEPALTATGLSSYLPLVASFGPESSPLGHARGVVSSRGSEEDTEGQGGYASCPGPDDQVHPLLAQSPPHLLRVLTPGTNARSASEAVPNREFSTKTEQAWHGETSGKGRTGEDLNGSVSFPRQPATLTYS